MRVFETKLFAKFARRERIADAALWETVERAEIGLIDADLGGGLIKQRVPRPGRGRREGFRTLIAIKAGEFAVFMLGFAKNDRDNVTDEELDYLRTLATRWLEAPERLEVDLVEKNLKEVEHE